MIPTLHTFVMRRRFAGCRLAVLVAAFMAGLAVTPVQAQSPAYSLFWSDLSSSNGAYRSGILSPVYSYIDGVYTPLEGYVEVKITGFDGIKNKINEHTPRRIEGYMVLSNDQGWLLLWIEANQLLSPHEAYGVYTIVDGGGTYSGASGGGFLEVGTDGFDFSDPRFLWYFDFRS